MHHFDEHLFNIEFISCDATMVLAKVSMKVVLHGSINEPSTACVLSCTDTANMPFCMSIRNRSSLCFCDGSGCACYGELYEYEIRQ